MLVCASGTPWESKLKAVPRNGAAPEVLTAFPLILPEPDAGIRKGFDEVLRLRGLLNQLEISFEVGGWATILAYVRDGFGVGLVSEGALTEAPGLVARRLDPAFFSAFDARLICRRASAAGDRLDLSEPAMEWRDALRSLTVDRGRRVRMIGSANA